ncbi:MAG: Hypoxanthine-guanine phosphoribosyltransferase [uncultured Chloroflexi bacterium]|uniref:Hypoxanthine-guanine phosphoribosyltransferase n=1 Tax=uncultured Chloroflexota bacterium TaxID=166587 RepID=A0A6J4K8T2_9CHLR|nr:MAG: Hypoxanthine-guanine phosphoribosyltransferase [uncultured Chloroflexota bacterium]
MTAVDAAALTTDASDKSTTEVLPPPQETIAPRTDAPAFAHPSEAEFARVLDFYQLQWQYEPRSFPLREDESGRIIERFTPDFYLPDLDLYIELTTLKQSLVTKKNRKLRRLRELYPEVNIKLLYRRDFLNLARKFGLRMEGQSA